MNLCRKESSNITPREIFSNKCTEIDICVSVSLSDCLSVCLTVGLSVCQPRYTCRIYPARLSFEFIQTNDFYKNSTQFDRYFNGCFLVECTKYAYIDLHLVNIIRNRHFVFKFTSLPVLTVFNRNLTRA